MPVAAQGTKQLAAVAAHVTQCAGRQGRRLVSEISGSSVQMWSQGDAEKAMHLPVPLMFERTLINGLPRSQVGFFEHVVLPQYTELAAVYPGTAHVLAQAKDNMLHWQGGPARLM